MVIEYDYKPVKDYTPQDREKAESVHKFLCQILPYKEERDFALKILSSGLYGKTLENIIIFTGGGRNGKDTLCTVLLRHCLGPYYYLSTSQALMSPVKAGAPNQSIANMEGKRCVVYSETPTAEETGDFKIDIIK